MSGSGQERVQKKRGGGTSGSEPLEVEDMTGAAPETGDLLDEIDAALDGATDLVAKKRQEQGRDQGGGRCGCFG